MTELVLSVTHLNEHIKELLGADPFLSGVSVRGELSNFKTYPSGHSYFTLKDASSSLKCVMFRSAGARLRFRPENGMQVIVSGRVSVYERDGVYQLYAESMLPEGSGDLQLAFEQLKAKLEVEGLFDTSHKKPIPLIPDTVAVITSSAGAAVHDIIRVMGHRWPAARIRLLPVRVQGEEAPPEIVGALRYANRWKLGDVIIVGRGGGSLEDLWAFNDERVARAIYASEIPVISAVGHEPDVTIADYVADRRAATPSNAAELAVPDRAELRDLLKERDLRMCRAMHTKTERLRRQWQDLANRPALTDAKVYLTNKHMALDMDSAALSAAWDRFFEGRRNRLAGFAAQLDALSPVKVIGRGYAVAEKNGVPLRSVSDTGVGERLTIQITGGSLGCLVEEVIANDG